MTNSLNSAHVRVYREIPTWSGSRSTHLAWGSALVYPLRSPACTIPHPRTFLSRFSESMSFSLRRSMSESTRKHPSPIPWLHATETRVLISLASALRNLALSLHGSSPAPVLSMRSLM